MVSQSNDDDLVAVQVPRRYYEDVICCLAKKMSEDLPSSTGFAEKNGDSKWWTQERIQRLKLEAKGLKNSTVFTLLDLTANQPNTWISFETIYQQANRSATEARGDLRGLTMLIKRCFNVLETKKAWWPVKIRDGSPVSYRLPEEIAHRWKEAE